MKKRCSILALLLAMTMVFTACNTTSNPASSTPTTSTGSGTTTGTTAGTTIPTTGDTGSSTSGETGATEPTEIPGEDWENGEWGDEGDWEQDEDWEDDESWVDDEENEEQAPVLFTKISPENTAWAETLTPTFTWAELPEGTVYTLQIFHYKDGVYRKVREFSGLTTPSYTLKEDEKLAENELYRWRISATYQGKKYMADNGQGGLFVAKFNPKTHPANVGIDYTFQDRVSEEVLNNYLSRVLSVNYSECYDMWQENLRLILYTGAKYISRSNAESVWNVGAAELATHPMQKEAIAKAHEYDPEIVFEGGIFECVSRGVEDYKIPAYVFEDLGYPVEDRNFVFEDMINITNPQYSGETVFHSSDHGVPDITRKEAKLWFYYRATSFIDMGMEAIHMGIFSYIADQDTEPGRPHYTFVVNKIREYAKTHARRGFVFINSHTFGELQPDGKTTIFDFHAWTMRPIAPRDEVPHRVSDDNPQRLILVKEGPDLIYGRSIPVGDQTAVTPSGWEITNGLPYTVELDNAGGRIEEVGIPNYSWNTGLVWGIDEIGWFKIQPQPYRTYWLNYATDIIKTFDADGHMMMPGARSGTTTTIGLTFYRANNPEWGYEIEGNNDEEAIRNVFIKNRP